MTQEAAPRADYFTSQQRQMITTSLLWMKINLKPLIFSQSWQRALHSNSPVGRKKARVWAFCAGVIPLMQSSWPEGKLLKAEWNWIKHHSFFYIAIVHEKMICSSMSPCHRRVGSGRQTKIISFCWDVTKHHRCRVSCLRLVFVLDTPLNYTINWPSDLILVIIRKKQSFLILTEQYKLPNHNQVGWQDAQNMCDLKSGWTSPCEWEHSHKQQDNKMAGKKSMKRKSGATERKRERRDRKRLMFNHSTLHCFLITKSILRYSSPAALCVMLFMDSCLLVCPLPRGLYIGIGIQEKAVKGVKYRQRALLTWVVFAGGFQLMGRGMREDICSPTTCCGHSYCVFCEQVSNF